MSDRGNADFTVMKGFLGDFTVKEANEETLPPDPGTDVTESTKLEDKATGKEPKKGDNKFASGEAEFSKDASMVEEGQVRDIADGYVQDAKDSKKEEKGFETYNRIVSKGMAADVSINPYNVADTIATLEADTDEMIEKGVMRDIGNRALGTYSALASGARSAAGKVGGVVNTGRKKVAEGLESAADFVKNDPRAAKAGKVAAYGAGALGAGALGYGAYRGGRAIVDNKEDIKGAASNAYDKAKEYAGKGFDLDEDVKKKVDEHDEMIEKGVMRNIGNRALGAYSSVASGARKVAGKAGEKIYNLPPAVIAGGALAGAGGVGYGAYRGGKAILGDKDKEEPKE